ncbi:cysteine-rich CWC family protein [Halopseudomonas sp.]|uniref:cysteine-rich CWC family protein n=1 Tax=Halopseudomonas sp. TaxID=2901191 RepID=UPI0035647610
MQPLPSNLCPLCGGSNQCAPAVEGSFDTPCWCLSVGVSMQALVRIPADQVNKACLCPACAAGSCTDERGTAIPSVGKD